MMQQSFEVGEVGSEHDLQFSTAVDGSVKQNVPLPPPSDFSGPMMPMQTQPALPLSSPDGSGAGYGGLSSPDGSGAGYGGWFNRSSHPTACLFHVLFKSFALVSYLLGKKFGMEGITVTVLCILLLAADFWVVKNVTGRLLVGLRWWNKVDPTSGQTRWIFESADRNLQPGAVNKFDSNVFWAVLYLAPVVWGFMAFAAVLWINFQCLVTVSVAMVLSFSNVYGYYKCSSDQKAKLESWMNRGAQMGTMALFQNNFFGMFSGHGRGGAQPVPQQDGMQPGTFA